MKILTDSLHKIAYATDASAYREIPLGVAYPEDENDVKTLIAEARSRRTTLIARGAGTSIAGQVVGCGLIADVSRHMNRILEINAGQRWARVQPGVVRDELNLALKPHGLFFSPETSTSSRCTIGGMCGNNSCGTHSLVYGSTRDHVLAYKGVLSDGSLFDTEHPEDNPRLGQFLGQLKDWNETRRELIEANFPDRDIKRRSCGYAIDEALGGDLCKLLTGSEGTLAFITEIKLDLDPLPSENKMLLCAHCATTDAAFEANLVALEHHPQAVELIDDKIIRLGRDRLGAGDGMFFIKGDPAALLVTEFVGEGLEEKAAALEAELAEKGLAAYCSRVSKEDVQRVWDFRKESLGVLTSKLSDSKPAGVIEDTAVAPKRLLGYMKDFRAMMAELGLDCVYYGHISTGELHLRPILNLKDPDDVRKFREVASRTAELVRKHKGCLSGEHGDGRLRGEFLPLLYGEECYGLMKAVKALWDPDNVFNAGKIIDTPAMDISLRYDAPQSYEERDLALQVERCNGDGSCRKSNLLGGTMCPVYKLSGDETKTTRARSNVLREILTRGWKSGALSGGSGSIFGSAELREVLDSCLACKGCKRECPSSVDMAWIRAQVLQRTHESCGTPLRSWAVARMASFEKLGSLVAPLYNAVAAFGPTAALIKKIIGFAPQRSIPKIYRKTVSSSSACGRKIYFFLDEFTRYQEPDLALTFIALMEKLGYQVVIPKAVESGRASMSKGCLDRAAGLAEKNVRLLSGLDAPIVGLEPSCILGFRDEYPKLVGEELRDAASRLAANSYLFDEFLEGEVAAGRISPEQFRPDEVEIWLHGHCHQKALVGVEKTAKILALPKGARVHVIPSGCCGMAGSFGYEKEHYRESLAIGEMVLFPTVRKAVAGSGAALVAAPGTSCRTQIYDGTGVKAYHPVEILYRMLK